jgi:hypothetical protein
VAEHLALEEVGRDGRHVHRHERAAGARAQAVGGAREQLLAGAGLAGEQDRQRRARGLLQIAEQGQHGRIARHDAELRALPPQPLELGVRQRGRAAVARAQLALQGGQAGARLLFLDARLGQLLA